MTSRKSFAPTIPLPAGAPAAVQVGNRFFTSGIVSDRSGGLESESHRVFQLLAELLRSSGLSTNDVVRTRIWHTGEHGANGANGGPEHDPDHARDPGESLLRSVHGVVFSHPGPALTVVQVERLPGGAAVAVELEAVAESGDSTARFESDFESSSSLAVQVGDELWTSGLRGDPTADRPTQIRQAVADASGLMKRAGIGAGDIVSTRHFMRHDVQFESDPPEWLAFKEPSIPTSTGIAVNGVGAPDQVFTFELEGVAGAAAARTNLRTGRTFEVEHNYCRAVRVGEGDVIYVAGTTSLIPGEIIQHPGEVGPQVVDTLEIIRWAVTELGLEWDDLAQTRTYVVGGDEKIDEAVAALEQSLPNADSGGVASTVVGVPVLGRPGVVVEIEARAVRAPR
ncbi:MAG: Rid family hydrolase [Dehalococcoidia bacterium]|nr:Rid family hydrolase [Dehalococcoidia bacterium]